MIDADYRGAVECILHNSTDAPFRVSRGQRITQGIFLARIDANFKRVEQLPPADQSHEGFGSTGEVELVPDQPVTSQSVRGGGAPDQIQ